MTISISRRYLMATAIGGAFLTTPMLATAKKKMIKTADIKLVQMINGAWRSQASKARDQYRHPLASLTFWGLRPKMTIVEIDPGNKGWWVEILAPYAKATGGHYIAALPDRTDASLNDQQKTGRAKAHADFWAEVADKSVYGEPQAYDFGPNNLNSVPAGTADMVLVARAFHNWSRQGRTEPYLKAFYTMLKEGGILAVEQHRAIEGSDPKAGTGYVSESYVIEAARAAGFTLMERSEINANPKDTKDHPFGVWTLKPIRTSSDAKRTLTDQERADFDAIGESDRMTLRFKKVTK